jgi:hypothetical protein
MKNNGLEWWRNPDSLTYKIKKCYPDRMTNSSLETLLTIKLTCGFEAWGGYETWDSGFEAEDDKGRRFTSKTLEGLVTQIEAGLKPVEKKDL